MFAIGNIKDSSTLNNITRVLSLHSGGGGSKIYGVQFDPVNGGLGAQLYDAIGLEFRCATDKDPGVDDYTSQKGSPFDIKDVMMDYNPSTGKQEVIGTEDDSNWNTLVQENTYDETTNPNPQHNRMIRFPKFYYKRPDRYTWLVSSDPITGFSPSPMHYRNGVMYDYVYYSKYAMRMYSDTSGNRFYRSAKDQIPTYYDGVQVNNIYRDIKDVIRAQGMHVINMFTISAINMLIFIKYRVMDTRILMNSNSGTPAYTLNDGYLFYKYRYPKKVEILGKDGYNTTDNTYGTYASGMNYNISIMGIDDYVGNGLNFVAGLYASAGTNSIYIDPNPETSTFELIMNATYNQNLVDTNCIKLSNLAFDKYSRELLNDYTYPFLIYPNNSEPTLSSKGLKNLTSYASMMGTSGNDVQNIYCEDPGFNNVLFIGWGLRRDTLYPNSGILNYYIKYDFEIGDISENKQCTNNIFGIVYE